MLSIGELASYVGVTPRAVRFYHQRGLMPEPERDAAGYRRYGADAVIRLSRIVALAGAGVPLARIGTMLEADDEEFAADLARIDADVRAEIRRLTRVRSTLRELVSADRLALPPVLADVVTSLRGTPADGELLDLYRDGWVLNQVLYGTDFRRWFDAGAAEMFALPEYREILAENLRVAHLDPDDPAIEALAQRAAAWTSAHWDVQTRVFDVGAHDPKATTLVDHHYALTPAWERLGARIIELLREQGLDRPEFGAVDAPGDAT